MLNTWSDILCIQDCDENCSPWAKTAIPEDPNCCIETELAQICDLWFDPCVQNPMTSFDDIGITAWALDIDNTDTTGVKIKTIVVEGGIAEPEDIITPLPKGKSKKTKSTYTLTAVVKCIDEGLNNFFRRMQLGDTNFAFWYSSLGGYMYGDVGGISPTSVRAFVVHKNDATAERTWNLVITYEACVDPIRVPNPLA